MICALTGFITDPAKDADREAQLVILGAKVFYSFAEAWVASTIDDHKAEKWLLELEEIISQHKCDPDKAGRCAGRFSWACTIATGKIGRSFIKPMYAQAHSPLPGLWASPLLVRSCVWWKSYREGLSRSYLRKAFGGC